MRLVQEHHLGHDGRHYRGGDPPTTAVGTGGSCTSPTGKTGPGTGATTVGFIYVGSTSDFGYNQAAHAGSDALKAACPNLKILEAASIPETSDMVTPPSR